MMVTSIADDLVCFKCLFTLPSFIVGAIDLFIFLPDNNCPQKTNTHPVY